MPRARAEAKYHTEGGAGLSSYGRWSVTATSGNRGTTRGSSSCSGRLPAKRELMGARAAVKGGEKVG